ncbi:hypothetical protein ACFO4E_20340 [Nocardiopsis mangrovi]|uniref:Uncharacterized protein n=1 Tax=Nocardiopsis mangrovi TaxID=1179818 RepID=A0ABV9DZK1_9ACTN
MTVSAVTSARIITAAQRMSWILDTEGRAVRSAPLLAADPVPGSGDAGPP